MSRTFKTYGWKRPDGLWLKTTTGHAGFRHLDWADDVHSAYQGRQLSSEIQQMVNRVGVNLTRIPLIVTMTVSEVEEP